MAVTYGDIVDAMTAGIRGLDPQSLTDDRFDSPQDGGGVLGGPADWLLDWRRTTRQFDMRATSTTVADGTTSLATSAVIRIVYALETDLSRLDRVIQEDVQTVIVGVVRNPAHWGGAWSVALDGAPSMAIVPDGNGVAHNAVVSVPVRLSWPLSCSQDETYHAEVVQWSALEGQRARLVFRLRDSMGRPVSEAMPVALNYYTGEWGTPSPLPTFWTDASTNPATIATGSDDVAGWITTDSDGCAEIELRYAGAEPGDQRVRIQVSGQARKVDTGTVSIEGRRVFCDNTDQDALDDPASGAEAQPYATISYMAAQVADMDDSRDVAMCVVDGTYTDATEGSSIVLSEGAGLVGLSDTVEISGTYPYVSNQTDPHPMLVRNLTLDGSSTYGARVNVFSSAMLAGLRWTGSNTIPLGTGSSTRSPVRLVGCSMASASAYGLFCVSRAQVRFSAQHCDLESAIVCRVNGDYYLSVHDCTLTGSAYLYYDETASVYVEDFARYAGDRNTYSGAGSAFAYQGGGTGSVADLAAWQALTGQDSNSTFTP